MRKNESRYLKFFKMQEKIALVTESTKMFHILHSRAVKTLFVNGHSQQLNCKKLIGR